VGGDHAVVLGASMAGLLRARVLADAYTRVTVIERDTLPLAKLAAISLVEQGG
jgi:2-polyprenyl-6-methoxyphenol hydroxylase-like FAD-dependent oxidoreductase